MILRPALAEDHVAIGALVLAAFANSSHGHNGERDIVAAVRSTGDAVAELVAEDAGEIIGHVLFSRMTCTPDRFVVGLAPLSVAPHRQDRGVGAALARRGLDLCRDLGAQGAVVLGDPAYYRRFGFDADTARPIGSAYAGAPAFMAMSLSPGGLEGVRHVAYPSAFG